jgi:hypothetical protein
MYLYGADTEEARKEADVFFYKNMILLIGEFTPGVVAEERRHEAYYYYRFVRWYGDKYYHPILEYEI